MHEEIPLQKYMKSPRTSVPLRFVFPQGPTDTRAMLV